MSTKHTVMTASGPAKTPGWFSWRHQTNAAHVAARTEYQLHHGKAARRRKAAERDATSAHQRQGRKARAGELDPALYHRIYDGTVPAGMVVRKPVTR